MLINLTEVLTSEGKTESVQMQTEICEISGRMGTFSIIEKTPLSLILTNIGTNKASIQGSMVLSLTMECDRCLKPLVHKIELDFIRVVTGPDLYKQETDDDNEQNFMDGYQLNVEDLIVNECFINLPMKVLCEPDCKGLCKICGKDLNTGSCECDTFIPDPRMAGIKDIFDANKEV